MKEKRVRAGRAGEPALVITRIFNATRERVRRTWTDPEQVRRW
jgi:uncharacterized protein YndB with AHSA1/START domain